MTQLIVRLAALFPTDWMHLLKQSLLFTRGAKERNTRKIKRWIPEQHIRHKKCFTQVAELGPKIVSTRNCTNRSGYCANVFSLQHCWMNTWVALLMLTAIQPDKENRVKTMKSPTIAMCFAMFLFSLKENWKRGPSFRPSLLRSRFLPCHATLHTKETFWGSNAPS